MYFAKLCHGGRNPVNQWEIHHEVPGGHITPSCRCPLVEKLLSSRVSPSSPHPSKFLDKMKQERYAIPKLRPTAG